jgi:hypothetical protein
MVTVLRADGVRIVIYPNDHRPEHVHAIQAEKEDIFNLNCPNGPPELRENYGFSPQDIRRIRAILAAEVQKLCERWRVIHDAT